MENQTAEITVHVGFDDGIEEVKRQARELNKELKTANALMSLLGLYDVELSLSFGAESEDQAEDGPERSGPEYRFHVVNGDLLKRLGEKAKELNAALEKASSVLQELAVGDKQVFVSGGFVKTPKSCD